MSYCSVADVRLSERLQYVEQTIGDSLAKHAQEQRALLCSHVFLSDTNSDRVRSWRMPGLSWATCMRECRSARRGEGPRASIRLRRSAWPWQPHVKCR